MTGQVTLGVEDQLKNGWSLLNHYKKVINVRNKYPFLKQGVFTNMISQLGTEDQHVLAYKIQSGNDYIIIIHNFNSSSVTVNAIGTEIMDSINTSKVAPKLNGSKVTIGAHSTVLIK